jgi:hypothetical protein
MGAKEAAAFFQSNFDALERGFLNEVKAMQNVYGGATHIALALDQILTRLENIERLLQETTGHSPAP